jgi:hypothetical protein|tara:strand:+ start:1443 stop:1688 length:246 start_codon:yes stop_codon:yes gene_type:complete
MKFPLLQLYQMNRSKPIVGIGDEEVQWESCNLDELPPEREGVSMTDHGKIPRGQYENLPEVFTSSNGDTYKIEDIHSLKSS